jgi:hypothetical protein
MPAFTHSGHSASGNVEWVVSDRDWLSAERPRVAVSSLSAYSSFPLKCDINDRSRQLMPNRVAAKAGERLSLLPGSQRPNPFASD